MSEFEGHDSPHNTCKMGAKNISTHTSGEGTGGADQAPGWEVASGLGHDSDSLVKPLSTSEPEPPDPGDRQEPLQVRSCILGCVGWPQRAASGKSEQE